MEPPSSSPSFQYLSSTVDPVTKAVVDNILGKLPTKKERVTLNCTICNLDFSSQITLDMHLRGSRHSKKVQSQEILKSLQEKGSFIENGSTNLKCEICNVVSNSSQQLQMHLQGAKHQNKSKVSGANGNTITISSLKRTGSTSSKANDGTPPAKSVALRCETCNISLNSESQYQQHVDSKKHKNKISGMRPSPRKWINKKQNSSYPQYQGNMYQGSVYQGNTGNYQNGRKSILSGVPPLSQSFNMSNQSYDNYHHNNGGSAPSMW